MKQLVILLLSSILLTSACGEDNSLANLTQSSSLTKTSQRDSVTKTNKFPKPDGFVNDFQDLLTKDEEDALARLISDYHDKTTNQICIVTVDSILPYRDILLYATDLSNEWGVGKKDKNNGLTIVLCPNQMSDAIATGLGTEKVISDSTCNAIRENIMIPEYRNRRYYEGLTKGINEIIKVWGQ